MHQFGEGTEVVRVYMAGSLDEAQQAEAVLEALGLTFAVEVETFDARTFLGIGSTRQGAGLWLLEADLDAAYTALERAGLLKGLVDKG
jgi:hypothetical protein